MRPERVSRRQFLGSAMTIGGVALLQGCVSKRSAFRFFNEQDAELVALIAEQIIPADDAPGATDAGVIYFIDRILAGPHRNHRTTYSTGLERVRVTSERMYGRPFAELTSDEQTDLLSALESDQVPRDVWTGASAPGFFALVRGHTMQGFMGGYLERSMQSLMEFQSRLSEQSQSLTPELWTQFMNMQNPLFQNMMGSGMEQSKQLLTQMQEQMQKHTEQMLGTFGIKR